MGIGRVPPYSVQIRVPAARATGRFGSPEGMVGDFIQEDGSAVGHFKSAQMPLRGSGEGALFCNRTTRRRSAQAESPRNLPVRMAGRNAWTSYESPGRRVPFLCCSLPVIRTVASVGATLATFPKKRDGGPQKIRRSPRTWTPARFFQRDSPSSESSLSSSGPRLSMSSTAICNTIRDEGHEMYLLVRPGQSRSLPRKGDSQPPVCGVYGRAQPNSRPRAFTTGC